MGFLERYFFKKRHIFYLKKEYYSSFKNYKKANKLDFKINIIATEEELQKFPYSHQLGESAFSRLRNDNVALFLFTCDRVLAGYGWTIHGRKDQIVWHDKLPIKHKQGLIFNAFIFPEHRRRGLYGLCLEKRLAFLFFHEDCDIVFVIVENLNYASMHAQKNLVYNYSGKNYLIKFFGKNIF